MTAHEKVYSSHSCSTNISLPTTNSIYAIHQAAMFDLSVAQRGILIIKVIFMRPSRLFEAFSTVLSILQEQYVTFIIYGKLSQFAISTVLDRRLSSKSVKYIGNLLLQVNYQHRDSWFIFSF